MYAAYPTQTISEHQLRTFLRQPSRKAGSAVRSFGVLGLVALLSFGGYYLLNLDAFQRVAQSKAPVAVAASPSPSAVALANVPAATPTPAPVIAVSDIPDNTVSFADVNISAPVTWDTPIDNAQTIASTLQKGVLQVAGTAHPGQHGIVVVTGHSSNYPWAKGSYNSVFAPLQSAKAGQTVKVSYGNKMYTYEVTRSYVVKPTELSVLNSGSFDGLRLITCTPIGTSTNRLVIEAKQVAPDPSGNTAFSQASYTGGTIPSGQ